MVAIEAAFGWSEAEQVTAHAAGRYTRKPTGECSRRSSVMGKKKNAAQHRAWAEKYERGAEEAARTGTLIYGRTEEENRKLAADHRRVADGFDRAGVVAPQDYPQVDVEAKMNQALEWGDKNFGAVLVIAILLAIIFALLGWSSPS